MKFPIHDIAALRTRLAAVTARDAATTPYNKRFMTPENFFRVRPDLAGKFRFPEDLGHAGILVPIVDRPGGPTLLLTKRADTPHHPGDVVFPGGGHDADDASLRDTALREAEEELGLPRQFVEPIGFLASYPTYPTMHLIFALLAIVRDGFELRPATREVAAVLEVPLAYALDRTNHQLVTGDFGYGEMKDVFALPWQGHRIWGLAVSIIRDIGDLLATSE